MSITIKTGAEIDGMRVAGRLASEVLDMLTPHVKPGIPPTRSTSSRTITSSTCKAPCRHH